MCGSSTQSQTLLTVFLPWMLLVALLGRGEAEEVADGPLKVRSSGTLEYDFEKESVSFGGPVKADYGPYDMEAGKVIWNRGEDIVRIFGGALLTNPREEVDAEKLYRGGDFFEAWWPESYRGVPFVLMSESAVLEGLGESMLLFGGSSARFPYGRLNAESLSVMVPDEDEDKGTLEAENVRAGSGDFLLAADKIEADRDGVEMSDAAIFLGEPADPGPRIHANRLSRGRGDDYISLYGVTLGIGPLPVFYLPRAWLRDWDLGVSFDLGGGYAENLGVYGEFGVGFGVTEFLRLEPAFSLYGKRGLLLSPNFSWERSSDSKEYYTRGSVLSGWIDDQGGEELRGTDLFGAPIGASRGYALAQGLGNRRGDWSFVNQFEARSDSEVLRDFNSGLESRFFAPESFSELYVPFGAFQFTALGRFRTLDTTESIEAIPSIQVGLTPTRLGESGLVNEGWLGYARLEREDFEETDLASANRWEGAYRLSAPIQADRWLTITPLAGLRQRKYDDVGGRGADGSSTLFEMGVDLEMEFHRRWDIRSRIWDVDGLIHQTKPLIGYRWMPRTGMEESSIPQIHPEVYTSGVDPLGLNHLPYRSDDGPEQTFRVGVENRLIAGRFDQPFAMRSLGSLGLYQDINEAREGASSRASNTMLNLESSPAHWVGLSLFARVETETVTLVEFVPGIRLRDGDRWESRWYFQSLQRRVNQLLWDAEVSLSRRDRFLFEMRYSGQSQKVIRHSYGWQRRLGNAWLIQTQLIFRQDDVRESDFQINFSATSLLF